MTIQRNPPVLSSRSIAREAQGDESSALSIRDLLQVLRSHKLIIFGAVTLVVAIAAFVLSLMTPLYTASAYVILDQRHNAVMDASNVVPDLVTDAATIQNQVQILQSRNLAARVVDKLNLVNDPEFNPPDQDSALTVWLRRFAPWSLGWLETDKAPAPAPAPTPADVKEAAINHVLSDLTVANVGSSATITVSFTSQDAAKSAQIANSFSDAYVDDQMNAKFEATQKASQWLSERLTQVAAQTQLSERAVEQYKAANNLTDTVMAGAPTGTSIVQQQLSAVNLQLITAQADLAVQEAKYNQVMDMQRSGHAADVSQVVASPLVSQLRQQETDLLRQEAELSSRYGPRHPKVQDIESQKQNLSAKIDEEVRRVVETVANDVAVSRVRVRSLQESLAHTTAQTQGENLARVKLSELMATAASNRALHDALMTQFKDIEGKDSVQAPDARVISPATRPSSPSYPKKLLFLGASVPGGFCLGILLAMLSETLRSGFRTREQVESTLSLPVLAALPEVSRRARVGKRTADFVIQRPTSAFAEAIRGLKLELVLCNGEIPPKTIVVTSAVPAEGKTTVAVSLARIAARSGQRVILVDADFRRPGISKAIGMRTPTHGIADVLSGKISLVDCIKKDPTSDLLVVPGAGHPANPSDLLGSEDMEKLIASLAGSCDLLIVNSPPLLPVHDARILARLADAVILVVRWERTPRAASMHALRALADVTAPLAGIVLSRTNTEQFGYENYGRRTFRHFNKYYQE